MTSSSDKPLLDIDGLRKDLEPPPPNGPTSPNSSVQSIFLFFSFDLVGSTEFKSNGNDWVTIAKWFYRRIRDYGTLSDINATVWKYAGDEVLFYHEVADPNFIEEAVEAAHRILRKVCDELYADHTESRGRLSIKGVVWMSPIWVEPDLEGRIAESNGEDAEVKSDASDECGASDTMFQIGKQPGNPDAGWNTDFLGPNIDIGFRLAAFARKQQIVVSANLAYFILQRNKAKSSPPTIGGEGSSVEKSKPFLLVDFMPLKGVLGGDHYPCIWFQAPRVGTLADDFFYDDHLKDSLIDKAIHASQKSTPRDEVDLLEVLEGMYRKRRNWHHSHLLPYETIEQVICNARNFRRSLNPSPLKVDK